VIATGDGSVVDTCACGKISRCSKDASDSTNPLSLDGRGCGEEVGRDSLNDSVNDSVIGGAIEPTSGSVAAKSLESSDGVDSDSVDAKAGELGDETPSSARCMGAAGDDGLELGVLSDRSGVVEDVDIEEDAGGVAPAMVDGCDVGIISEVGSGKLDAGSSKERSG
jgi:hypothetical protein